ncbi:MAG: hypothetical protein ACRYGI_11580 [Janthinobacterium lividum]
MTDASNRVREVLAEHHNRQLFFAAPEIMPSWAVTAMLAYADERAAQAHAAGLEEGLEEAATFLEDTAAAPKGPRDTGQALARRIMCKFSAESIRAPEHHASGR